MLIWRNLDPKLLAQLLIQASVVWRVRTTTQHHHESGSGDTAAPSPEPKSWDGKRRIDDV
ncbi:hypothetical protein [Defluviicoccus vanus]|uniref:Uncharacterized protein n=1 Tax=Defluviicoccus vanus TaxID=111831 RepID=A0A7H1N539_9PROT|nr:hypothetical protein [Defluviicoccus vanus]QNT70825.1 hypothetical protein HQ394_17780 [Defluviicoccus vanus]